MQAKKEKCKYCGSIMELKTTRREFCSTKCRVYWNRGLITFRIYTISDPLTEEVFYVGCTRKQLSERLKAHIFEANHPNNKALSKKELTILSILARKEMPIIEEIEVVNGRDLAETLKAAYQKEASWILYFRQMGVEITNVLLLQESGVRVSLQGKRIKSIDLGIPDQRKTESIPPKPSKKEATPPATLKGIDLAIWKAEQKSK